MTNTVKERPTMPELSDTAMGRAFARIWETATEFRAYAEELEELARIGGLMEEALCREDPDKAAQCLNEAATFFGKTLAGGRAEIERLFKKCREEAQKYDYAADSDDEAETRAEVLDALDEIEGMYRAHTTCSELDRVRSECVKRSDYLSEIGSLTALGGVLHSHCERLRARSWVHVPGPVIVNPGTELELRAVASLANGQSRAYIYIDDGCYVLGVDHGNGSLLPLSWWFAEAVEVLRKLPNPSKKLAIEIAAAKGVVEIQKLLDEALEWFRE